MNNLTNQKDYNELVSQISATYNQGRQQAVQTVNIQLVTTYWEIGRYIVEFEQKGEGRAAYGKALLEQLAADLSMMHGKGFSRSNLNYMRLVYRYYPICEEVPHKLSWTHLCELVKIDDSLERSCYAKQAVIENWSTTELKRQKKASLFLRLAASKDKEGILHLAKQGQFVSRPEDVIRDPYILDFLKIPELYHYSETGLEGRIIEHLQHFFA